MSARTGGGSSSNNTRRGNGIEKPWASGRVLTPEQRARKQEADRKANRFLKKEVQERLSLLESRVAGLEKTTGEKVTVKTAPSADGDAGCAGSEDWNVPDRSGNQPTSHAGEADSPDNNGPHNDEYFPSSDSGIALRHTPRRGGPETLVTDSSETVREAPTPDFTDVSTIARTRSEGRHMTCFLNNLVNYIRTLPPAAVCFEDQYNQDLIITAALKGWDFTLARYAQRCPLWEVLRLVDLYLFRDANMLERVSCLRMLHKRYLFEINANIPSAGPPPPWYRPQFCEKVFFHDPVIDHLTWPSLRDHMISSESDRLTNKFWLLYVRNIRVTWKHEPLDMMSFSQQTQLYFLSPQFEEALWDLDNWRMDMDFFRGIPQLAGVVPPYNYVPLKTHTPKFGTESAEQTHRSTQEPAQTGPRVATRTPVRPLAHDVASQSSATRYIVGQDATPQQQHQHQHQQNQQHQQHLQLQQQQQQQQQQLLPQHFSDIDHGQWLMRPQPTFIDSVPALDMSKFTPAGQWHEHYG